MKYRIEFQRNNDCDFPFERVTNHLVVALWYLFTLMLKYPIITLKIVRGEIECAKCTADWCGRSPACPIMQNPMNCTFAEKKIREGLGAPERGSDWCCGYQKSETNDEPCERCGRCRAFDGYEEED